LALSEQKLKDVENYILSNKLEVVQSDRVLVLFKNKSGLYGAVYAEEYEAYVVPPKYKYIFRFEQYLFLQESESDTIKQIELTDIVSQFFASLKKSKLVDTDFEVERISYEKLDRVQSGLLNFVEIVATKVVSSEFDFGEYLVFEMAESGVIYARQKSAGGAEYSAKRQHLPYEAQSNSIVNFERGKRFGYLDRDEKIFIPPIYERCIKKSEGLLLVCKGGKFGFLDTNGSVKIDLVFDDGNIFSDGLASVCDGKNYFYIKKCGTRAFEKTFERAYDYCGGLAVVENNGQEYYIDKGGDSLFKIGFKEAYNFSEGLAGIRVDEGYTFVTRDGAFPIRKFFDEIGGFVGGKALVASGGETYFINKSGDRIW